MNLAQIQAMLHAGSQAGGRTALFPEGKDPEKWKAVREKPHYARVRQELAAAAAEYRARPILALPFSLYKINDLTGSRKEYEAAYYEHRGRLNAFAGMALLHGRKEDLEALEDAIWAVCDEYTWCLPAHLGGKSLRIPMASRVPDDNGGVTTADREHRCVIDLFSAETGFALAEILYLLGDRLAPLVARRARREVVNRILKPFASIDAAYVWETITNNWAAVCAGSVGAAALYLIPDDDALTPLVYRLLGVMDMFLSGYDADGACTEGIGYWEYGFGFFVYFAELLRRRTAGGIDLLADEKVRRMALFAQKCFISENCVASFSDTGTTFRYHPGLFCFLKQRYPEMDIPDSRFECGLFADHCFRWSHFIRDFVWNAEAPYAARENSTFFLPNAQWMVARSTQGGRSFGFAAKGGHNAESHNHNDLGSFVCAVNGDMLLTDLGSGEYTREYFGPNRYTLLCNGSQGHSVPIVEGRYQSPGEDHRARVVEASESASTLTLDLTAAYDDDNLHSLTRRFAFRPDGRAELTVADSFAFGRAPSGLTERFVSSFAPEIAGDGAVKIGGPKGGVLIRFDPEELTCRLRTDTFLNHSAAEETVHILDFEWNYLTPAMAAAFTISVLPADR